MMIDKVDQIGLVVYNLDKKVEELEKMGLGPFTKLEIPSLEVLYRGETKKIRMKIAMAHTGNIQLELIEAEGECFYTDFLEEHGEGLNHLGTYVQDIEKEKRRYTEKGVDILQEGEIYGVKWVYLDTYDKIGFVIELIQVP